MLLGCICCKATAMHSPGCRRSTRLPNTPALLPAAPGKHILSQQRCSTVGAQHLTRQLQSLPSCDNTAFPSFLPFRDVTSLHCIGVIASPTLEVHSALPVCSEVPSPTPLTPRQAARLQGQHSGQLSSGKAASAVICPLLSSRRL